MADIRVKFKKIFIYLAIACCNGTGDVLLKRGMENLGEIHLNHWTHIFNAFIDPWVILGILFLAGFFYSYLTALSWADLTYVLPATAFGYVVTAFLSRFFLHETVSPWRWAGVLLITCGVGLVARGPSLTERAQKIQRSAKAHAQQRCSAHQRCARPRSNMNSLKLWTAIGMLVLASSAGDVMLSAAMKRIGDLDLIRMEKGLLGVISRVIREKLFLLGLCCLIFSFFCLLTALSWGDASLVAPASASLTYICSAIMAKFLLHENVDRRRWLSAALVCVGVLLLVK